MRERFFRLGGGSEDGDGDGDGSSLCSKGSSLESEKTARGG